MEEGKQKNSDNTSQAHWYILQNGHASPDVYKRQIEENVDTREYQVLVKPHQIVYYHIKDTVGITGQYIPATVDTNELLRATDVLISDYSSIYFDYLVSKKPILFFIPDLAE